MSHSFIALLILLFSLTHPALSQSSNLVFYCNDGEKFTVILNGVRQNPAPETNIKITNLVQPYYKAKILFENNKLAPIEKTINFNPGTETIFTVKLNNKGIYILRWQSETPLAQAPPPSPEQTVIIFTTVAPPPIQSSTTISTTTTTVSGSGGVQPPGTGVSIDIHADDAGAGVNLNIGTGNTVQTSGSTTTTTTTTTTSGSGTHGHHPIDEPVYVLPGYTGPVGCPMPVSGTQFSSVKQSISSKSFEDSKLQIAKQVIGSNCLLASQVKEIMLLFSFEDSRLDFAKYAYPFTYDIGNYFKVNDAFTFESSIEELNEYIQSAK